MDRVTKRDHLDRSGTRGRSTTGERRPTQELKQERARSHAPAATAAEPPAGPARIRPRRRPSPTGARSRASRSRPVAARHRPEAPRDRAAYAPQGRATRAGPTQVHGRVSASGGYGPAAAAGRRRAARRAGWPAPGYGPAGSAAGYRSGIRPGRRPAGRVRRPTRRSRPAGGTRRDRRRPRSPRRRSRRSKRPHRQQGRRRCRRRGHQRGARVVLRRDGHGRPARRWVGVQRRRDRGCMQHSLDKTRDTVKARIKLPGGGPSKVASTTEVPAPRRPADRPRPACSSRPVISRPRSCPRCPRVDARRRRSPGAGCW